MIDSLISLMLFLLILWLFGDLLIEFVSRFVAFAVCSWLEATFQRHLTEFLVETRLAENSKLAEVVAFCVVCVLCWLVLCSIRRHIRDGSVGDGQAVALDAFRTALVAAIGLAVYLMLASLTAGTLLLVSWIWICVFALVVAGLDVCCPSALGRVASCLDGSVYHLNT